jgi:hypothetical protein
MSQIKKALSHAEKLYATIYAMECMSEETSEDSELLFSVGEICDELRVRIQAEEEGSNS